MFLAIVVAFRAAMAGKAGDQLLAILEQLSEELDEVGSTPQVPAAWLQDEETSPWRVSDGPEVPTATALRKALAALAAKARRLEGGETDPRRDQAVKAALDGAQLVICSEIVIGRSHTIPSHLPSFVFMVTLPTLGRREALALSERTAELLDAA